MHWYGCWLIGHVIRESLVEAFSDADSTIVLRHRPDECFRKCFHLESARRVFARWRYLILGQPISGDNGLTTNWATYTDIIAAGFILDPKANPIEYKAALSSSWSSHEYCHGITHPKECNGRIPYCRLNNNTAPCRPPIFLSWEQHCLCRLRGKEPTLSSWCIDKKPPDKPLKKACIEPRSRLAAIRFFFN